MKEMYYDDFIKENPEVAELDHVTRLWLYFKKCRPEEDLMGFYYHKFKKKPFIGDKFGKLTIEEPIRISGKWWYRCRCECGNTKNVKTGQISKLKYPMCAECSKKEKDAITTNKYDLTGEYGVGWDSDGNEFWFDLEDYDKIKDISWHKEKGTWYFVGRLKGQNKRVAMHRLVCDADEHTMVRCSITTPGIGDFRKRNLEVKPMEERSRIKHLKNRIKRFELKNGYKICAYVKTKEDADRIENLLTDICNESER